MTKPEAHFTEHHLKKQSQFSGERNEYKYLYERVLWVFLRFWAARKQTQFRQATRCRCGIAGLIKPNSNPIKAKTKPIDGVVPEILNNTKRAK